MFARVVSYLYWAIALAIGIVMMPVAVLIWALTAPWDRRRVVVHQFTCLWGSIYSWINPMWRLRVEGRENMVPGQTYVIVANHASAADILVVYRLFRHFKWVSKAENFRAPIVGWTMTLNRYIPLRRGDKNSIIAMFDACRRELQWGSSVLLFPEGTRSLTDELRPFKRGAFEIAKSTRLPILPIVLEGTRAALASHGMTCGRATMVVRILPPILPASFENTGPQELADQVREVFVQHLASLRRKA
jgi:1-acyl-sn-glycerol-3-phosphate acyltransferase